MVSVTEFTDDISPAIAQVKLSFKSSKPGIAAIDENGVITAKKAGNTTITMTVVLADNTSRKFKTKITVKEAYIHFVEPQTKLITGEKCTYTIESEGYDISKIKWMTAQKKSAVVGKNTGKTEAVVTAVSKGKDTLYLWIGKKRILELPIQITTQ